MQRNKPCVIRHGGRTCDATGVFAGTSVQAAFLLVMIGMSAGFGVYYALRSAGIVASIGTATNRNMFEVGSWFRYDLTNTRAARQCYVITNITGITTAGDATWGDPIAASVLGASARWYKWSIKVYLVANNNEYPEANYIRTYDWIYLMQYLISGYKTTRNTITASTFDPANSFHATRPMFVSYGTVIYKSLANTDSLFSYVKSKDAFSYSSGVGYDPETGILLWTSFVDSGNYGQTYWMVLTSFSVKNPMIVTPPTAPPAPVFSVTTPTSLVGATTIGKRVTISNYDSSATYELFIQSSNQSVIVGQGTSLITFSTQSYDLNVLKAGITTLSILLRAKKTGIYSAFSTQTLTCDTRPAVIPPVPISLPSRPTLTVSPSTSTNGTIFLTWTASLNSPVYYDVYKRKGSSFTSESNADLMSTILASQPRKYTYQSTANGTYYFAVRGVNDGGKGDFSVVVSSIVSFPAPPPPPPPVSSLPSPPTLSTPTIINGNYNENVSLSWSSSTGATGYNVYRKIGVIFTNKSLATLVRTTSGTTFIDVLPVLYQMTVYYAVTATNATGESALSAIKSVIATVNVTRAATPNASVNGTVVTWDDISYGVQYKMYLDFNDGEKLYLMDAELNTTWDFANYLPLGIWNISITAMTSIDDLESYRSNSVMINMTNFTGTGPTDDSYGFAVPAPDIDAVVLVVFIIVISVTGVMVVFFLRQKLIKKK